MKYRLSPFFLFAIAYGLRILYPSLYITGSDMPGHILASMRLHLASPFGFNSPEENFFYPSAPFQTWVFNNFNPLVTL